MDFKRRNISLVVLTIMIMLVINSCAQESEFNPPDTTIEQAQTVYGKSGVTIVVSGKDDKTPVEKLTYKYFVYKSLEDVDEEGEFVFEGTSGSGLLKFDSDEFLEGKYIIKVTAVNEYGVSDKTPAQASFEVDLTPPQIPVLSYKIVAGEVFLNIAENSDTDIAGYDLKVSNSQDIKAFLSTRDGFTFKANRNDLYKIIVIAYDHAGNSSSEGLLDVDTSVDNPPELISELPDFLGKNDRFIALSVDDDWTELEDITIEATFCGENLQIQEGRFNIDLSLINEGMHTMSLFLKDDTGNSKVLEKEIFIDLTPPQIPFECSLKESGSGYIISWKDDGLEEETFNIYGFNEEDDMTFLETVTGNTYRTSERFLHYVITALDKALNESSPSYPVRTYNEKYLPVTSPNILEINENTLLTSLYSPYMIDREIEIPQEVILGIEKGVELIISGEGSFWVKGQLLSMPSNSSKERVLSIATNGQYTERLNDSALIVIDGGSVWLNEFNIVGDDNSNLTMFEISDGGQLRAQYIKVSGFDVFLNTVDSDSIVVDESLFETTVFSTGTNAKVLRLSNSTFKTMNAINVENIQQLEINNCQIEASNTALNLNGFTNAVINDSTISGSDSMIINKLSAVDAKSTRILGSRNAVMLKGASTLNIRKSTIAASNTALFVDRSAYLCAIESTITHSEVGIQIINPNLHLKDVWLVQNLYGIKGVKEKQWEESEVLFVDNEVDTVK